jgi:hypothetical protein
MNIRFIPNEIGLVPRDKLKEIGQRPSGHNYSERPLWVGQKDRKGDGGFAYH